MHEDIETMAEDNFKDHQLTKLHEFSWRCGKPNSGFYSFVVTWTPGSVIVTGGIGYTIYNFHDAATLYGAIALIRGSHFDYLTSKSIFKKAYDYEETIAHIISEAKENLDEKWVWSKFKEHCTFLDGDINQQSERQEVINDLLAGDFDLSKNDICEIFSDHEMLAYQYPPKSRWTFEAVKKWVDMMTVQNATELTSRGNQDKKTTSTLNEIVRKYLQENGFDGLYREECGCENEDLFPCVGKYDCKPGFKIPCECGEGHTWDIVPDKRYSPEKFNHKSKAVRG